MVSIIVPVYKVEPYIRQCVESVLGQTYSNFELILVDDGSPDSCGAICDEYAEKDSRVRVIHQENGGVSAVRNAGLDIMKGEYVAFIDSDDHVPANYLEKLYCTLTENNCLISACDYVRSIDKTNEKDESKKAQVIDGLTFYKHNSLLGVVVWAKLYRSDLFKSIRFPVGKIHEDEAVIPKVLYYAGNIAFLPEKMYFYTQNENSIMNTAYSVGRLDELDFIDEQCAFFKKVGRSDMLVFARHRFIEESCSHILRLTKNPDYHKYLLKTQAKLRKRLLQWGPGLKMSPFKNKWEYLLAFPKNCRVFVTIRDNVLRRKRND